jgi:hypothetical protein
MPPDRGTKTAAPESPALNDEIAKKKQTTTSSQLHLERPAPTMSSEQTIRSDAEHSVDQLSTGPIISGRNWSCEVKKYPDPSTKGERAHFWLINGDTEERWFGSIALSAQRDMAAASRIALDIANAANRRPGCVQDISKQKAPLDLALSITASLILDAAVKRQAPGSETLPAPTLQAAEEEEEEEGYYIKWSASCIDPVTSRRWTFRSVISVSSATQASTTSLPYFPNLQFTTEAGARLLSVSQEDGRDVHESVVPDQIPDLSTPWTSQVDKRAAILQAERLARALVAEIDGMKLNKASAKALVQHYSEKYGGTSSAVANGTIFGLHGGLKLYDIRRDVGRGGYFLSPSEHVRKHIDPSPTPLPALLVKSLDRDRLVLVLDVLNETWLLTGSIIEAWMEGAEAAEAATRAAAEGVPPQYMGRGIQFEPRLQVLQNQLSLLGIE